MQAVKRFTQKFSSDEQGQDLIEYTLLLAFVALASAALLTNVGASSAKIWNATNTFMTDAATGATSALTSSAS